MGMIALRGTRRFHTPAARASERRAGIDNVACHAGIEVLDVGPWARSGVPGNWRMPRGGSGLELFTKRLEAGGKIEIALHDHRIDHSAKRTQHRFIGGGQMSEDP